MGIINPIYVNEHAPGPDRSHALRGNAFWDAPRPVTRSVTGCIPTRSVGTIKIAACRSSG
ncbi:hypothetical protein EJA71_11095 [Pseudomonas sp. PB106]|nr:hypothetical protein EJA71_11095 [Pseudomonas sp. PB106]